MKLVIVAFEQFTDIDVFFPWDILNRIKLVGDHQETEVKILGTDKAHTSMAGLTIPTHGLIEEVREADAVIFASGVGVQSLYKNESYLSRLKVDPSRQLIGSMCSGALLLGGLGLLEGKKATTYPTVVHQLRELGVEVVEESFVRHGNIATAAGCLAAQDLTRWIITTLYGEDMANTVFSTIQPVGTK